MGLFDFITDAGEKLANKVPGSTSGEAVTETVNVSSERVDQLRGEQIAGALAQLDIDGEQVRVEVNGSVAVLTGMAPSQESLEKMVLCAGNQYGIGQVDCRLEVEGGESAVAAEAPAVAASPAPAAESAFYTVQSGDTLGKIAQQHYGAASKYTVIFEANQPMLSDPDKIYPGQKLRIPPL